MGINTPGNYDPSHLSSNERTLSSEQEEQLLSTVKARFEANMNRHEGIEWSKVKSSLEAKPEALWSINEMEKAGHEPDVYRADDEVFDIGTCSEESPEQHRNIVYDAEAAGWLRENYPDEENNGSAAEIAEVMGIDLMDHDQYIHLQKKGKYDRDTWSWLKTPKHKRKDRAALNGRRFDDRVRTLRTYAYNPNVRRAFRGSLRVLWS